MFAAKLGFVWICFGSLLSLYPAGLLSSQDTNRGQRDADRDQSDVTFEEALRLVIVAGRERFRPLKSFRVEVHPGRDYWYEVKVAFPGAEWCRIYEHPEMVYVCNWRKSKTKRASLPS